MRTSEWSGGADEAAHPQSGPADAHGARLGRLRGPRRIIRRLGGSPARGRLIIDECRCGATRQAESNGGRTYYGGWLTGDEREFMKITSLLVNLTPHEVVLGGDGLRIPPSGSVARCSEESTSFCWAVIPGTFTDGPGGQGDLMPVEVEIVDVVAGPVSDLPAPKDGTKYIVSRMVAEAAHGRGDLVFPFDLYRDAAGVIVGARKLGRVCHE